MAVKRSYRVGMTIFALAVLAYDLFQWLTHRFTNQTGLTLTIECLAGILLIYAPFILERWLGIHFAPFLIYWYWLFLVFSVFLGTCIRLMTIVAFWDKLLHFTSPMILTAVGYGLLALLIPQNTKIKAGLYFLFGFAFAELGGIIWELWEFTCDGLANMNLQRYMTSGGVPYVGRTALLDTMGDIITNTTGALVFLVISWYFYRKNRAYFQQFAITKVKHSK